MLLSLLADYEVQANKSQLAAMIQQQRNLGRVPTMITGVYSPMGGQPYFTGESIPVCMLPSTCKMVLVRRLCSVGSAE